MPDPLDLTILDRDALARKLRELTTGQWNAAVRAARKKLPGWRADLFRASLSGADLSEADLSEADLSRANLSGASLSGADLSEATLFGADLSGADLSRADLSRAYLSGANLSRADLSEANLSGANLYEANLSEADLSGANILDANGALHTLTGRHAWIGEADGYPVLMLATDHEAGHVLRAGCWTGLLDDAVQRAVEEHDSPLVRVEAEAVVAHGRALLAAWKEDTDA